MNNNYCSDICSLAYRPLERVVATRSSSFRIDNFGGSKFSRFPARNE